MLILRDVTQPACQLWNNKKVCIQHVQTHQHQRDRAGGLEYPLVTLKPGEEAGALIRLLQGEGSFAELLEGLMKLRSTLEAVQDRYCEHERTVDRMYWNRTTPAQAAELVLRLPRIRLRAIDDLILNLPSRPRRHMEG
jgi:hypothetical protein